MHEHPLESVFSADLGTQSIIISSVYFNPALCNLSSFEELNISLPEQLSNAVTRRQAEFLAGRCAARQSLRELGMPDEEIAIGAHRAPVWPKNLVASITHTENTAICAAALRDQIRFLGIDLEQILGVETVNEIKPSIINTQEESLLRSSDLPFEAAFTLAFSAKESLFKALYYDAKRYLDFDAAEVVSVCTKTTSFCLRLTEDWSPAFPLGTAIHGRYYLYENQVFTCVYEELA